MTSWNDTLMIGVPLIDDQHKELVHRMDKLMSASRSGKGAEEIEKTLRFVVSYFKEHFNDEEDLQSEYKYPEMQEHKKLHADFTLTVIKLVQDFQLNGPNQELAGKVNKMLLQWVIKHIRTEDKKLAAYIQYLCCYIMQNDTDFSVP